MCLHVIKAIYTKNAIRSTIGGPYVQNKIYLSLTVEAKEKSNEWLLANRLYSIQPITFLSSQVIFSIKIQTKYQIAKIKQNRR